MKIVIPIDRKRNQPKVVFRGGIWSRHPAMVQVSYRYHYYTMLAKGFYGLGFRIVRN